MEDRQSTEAELERKVPLDRWALALALLVLALVAGRMVVEDRVGFQRVDGTVVEVQDYGALVNHVQHVWTEGVDGSAYSVATHRAATVSWYGSVPEIGASRFAYTPTLFLVLVPFALLPMTMGYLLWVALGLSLAVWLARHQRVWAFAAGLSLLTPVAIGVVGMGQSVLFSMPALLWLVDRSGDEDGTVWPIGVVIAALAAKPPIGILAAAGLLAARRWRPVVYGAGVTVLVFIALTPVLGTSWPVDYVHQVLAFDTPGDALFEGAVSGGAAVGTMANLKAVVGGGNAVHIAVWGLALASIILAGWRRWIGLEAGWALAVLSYLLLCPHVLYTEELTLLLVPAAVVPADRMGSQDRLWWLAVPLALMFSPGLGLLASVGPVPLVVFKLLFVGIVLWRAVDRQMDVTSPSNRGIGSGGVSVA